MSPYPYVFSQWVYQQKALYLQNSDIFKSIKHIYSFLLHGFVEYLTLMVSHDNLSSDISVKQTVAMNNRSLSGIPSRPGCCSASCYRGLRPVISIRGKKSGVRVSVIRSLCFVKRWSNRLRMACFQCINQCHSFRHVRWLGSLFFEDRACSQLLQE